MVTKPEDICFDIQASLVESGLFSSNGKKDTWRISPEPYYLSGETVTFFVQLGDHLLKFYKVLNQFYLDSVKGKAPPWFAEYLDMGKPTDLVDYGRMNRFKQQLPGIIRPDVLLTEKGYAVTELDAVPGGFGLTAKLMALYKDLGETMVGQEREDLANLFYRMIQTTAGTEKCTLAIVVSDEAEDYRNEMNYLGNLLKERGFPVYVVHPREIMFQEDGLFLNLVEEEVRIDVIYRFFELFDLKNIPKSELFLYSNKKGNVKTTPPYKTYLEEKLCFALFHHPALSSFWEKALGPETFNFLSHLIPRTWILDHREIPPHGVIPGLEVRGNSVHNWQELFSLTQKEREMVIKPSGFSPLAWGSRGVTVGHDVSEEEWMKTLNQSLADFPKRPWILQAFYKAKRLRMSYLDGATRSIKTMGSRVRLTPYYFIVDGASRLGGILATLCPEDKKKIHGMTDAVMVPCAVSKNN